MRITTISLAVAIADRLCAYLGRPVVVIHHEGGDPSGRDDFFTVDDGSWGTTAYVALPVPA